MKLRTLTNGQTSANASEPKLMLRAIAGVEQSETAVRSKKSKDNMSGNALDVFAPQNVCRLIDGGNDVALSLVRVERLELPRLAAPEPKSGVSTNFTIPAYREMKQSFCR